jgi:cobalt-zinc-cadmium efflux system outer membrane protein
MTLFLLLWLAGAPATVSLPDEERLGLREAVALARAHSPLAAAARARAEGAGRAADVAGRLADPTFDFAVENLRPWASDFDAGSELDVFAVAVQPLDLFTRSGRKAEARGLHEEILAGHRATEQEVVLETVRRYLEALRGRDLEAALAEQSGNLASIVAAMERRVAQGYAAEADLLRFRAEAARAENFRVLAAIERDRAEAALGFLLGRAVRGVALVAPELPPPPPGDPDAIGEAALEYRPDVLAARARVGRARGTLSLEEGRRWPDLALAGGYKRTGGFDTAVVGVQASVPIFQRNRRARALAEGAARAAELELEATRARARAEVAVLVRAARSLQARLARLDEDLVRPAEEARRSAVTAFAEGAVDVLRVVDAERTHADARRDALDLAVDAFLASCRARLAAGLEALP